MFAISGLLGAKFSPRKGGPDDWWVSWSEVQFTSIHRALAKADLMSDKPLDPAYLRQQIVGVDSTFETPFGERLMLYCDYTASGRCLRFVEAYLQGLQRIYANTHTEDDITGRSMSQLLHEAEESIKRSVNAGPNGRIIACGTGATGAIDKLQQIVGVALAPASRKNIYDMLTASNPDLTRDGIDELFESNQPVPGVLE